MGPRILWLLLCVGLLSPGTGCYVVPAPYDYYTRSPYVYAYPRRYYYVP
jgi:hypothetical protein